MQVTTQMGPFSIVPEWVLDRGLSSTALKLYIVLARFADWETGIAFPARDTLAQRMDCSEKTVDRAVKELVDAECIEKQFRGRYASARYRVLQVDPRGTKLSAPETELSDEGTNLSSRPDKNVHITITNKREPKNDNRLSKPKPKNADEYQPSDAILANFDSDYPGLRLDMELEKFRNHHMAKGSSFKDWDRAFRNWLSRASEWSKEARAAKAKEMADADWERFKRENGLD